MVVDSNIISNFAPLNVHTEKHGRRQENNILYGGG